ncbi:MAG: thioredoxin domain-containing protein [Alphaproteobacteria bacterium]|nr:thioredoxin domain-containing protein [Alphaproteobacteria bacterium]
MLVKKFFIGFVFWVLCYSSCLAQNLLPIDFSQKIKADTTAIIIDVRSAAEFSKGHLENAINLEWNDKKLYDFAAKLDKNQPIFVYCTIGGRSTEASKKLRKEGYNNVYELEGGLIKWRSQNLPEIHDNKIQPKGMSLQEFNTLINSDKLVLIDFYAEWCIPCKKMKPYLEEISKDMVEKVTVIRINVDDNQNLCKELQIDALPVLQLYQNKILIWKNIGFIEKADVLSHLK